MGRTDVTVSAYRMYVAAYGKQVPSLQAGPQADIQPVVNVSWDDANSYCRWIGGRLPTEAEWEYAARAGSPAARYGNLKDIAWYKKNSDREAHPVAQKQPNSLGLYDMLGNVWQWVGDWYGEKYYSQSAPQDPQGPSSGQTRGLRGGAWNQNPEFIRVSFRGSNAPGLISDTVGFRCVGELR